MKIEPDAEAAFQRLVRDAAVYWRTILPRPDGDRQIVVEGFHTEFRVMLRNLAIANAIRRIEPARLVILAGVDPRYTDIFAAAGTPGALEDLARAYGADEIIDVHAAARAAADDPQEQDDAVLERTVRGTHCRLTRTPELVAGDPQVASARSYARRLRRIYRSLFAKPTVAFVTSHVDYDQWELAVAAARENDVPVVHTQQTGAAKAYTLFPEADSRRGPFRTQLTTSIGEFFEERVWADRDALRQEAELVAYRSRQNLGRPSWWRAGTDSLAQMTNDVQRSQVRPFAASLLGVDPAKPVVACFNHATSDALGTNVEAYPNLAEWFAATADFAAERPDATWLFLDHPQQAKYDRSGFFDGVRARHTGRSHMLFARSTDLSKNQLWSLLDLATTVRGSVSNELPAYGIPVIQAGWSEWSSCGLGTVVTDPGGYLSELGKGLDRLVAGEQLCTPEQVERARLWHWLYRGGADVTSGLIPHWEFIPQTALFFAIGLHMRYVESINDPLFDQVEHMWRNREPMLTRRPMVPGGARSGQRQSIPTVREAMDAEPSAV